MDELSVEIFNSLVGKDIKIIGERKEEYEGEVCEGTNCDFEYKKEILTRDIVCIECEGKKYEIKMHNTYGECPSGWTRASWSHMEIRDVEEFEKLTHRIKEPTIVRINKEIPEDVDLDKLEIICGDGKIEVIDDLWDESSEFKSIVFSWMPIGGDGWYPWGRYSVRDEAFIEINRQEEIEEEAKDEVQSKRINLTEEQLEKAKNEFSTFIKATISDRQYSQVRPALVMKDGEEMSVQASEYHYCYPRESRLEKYEAYEVGFPSKLFEELEGRGETPDTTDTVFGWIEEEVITTIIAKHGGIDFERTLDKEKCEELGIELEEKPQETTLDKLTEMVRSLAKLVEEQRKAIEEMRSVTKNIDPKKSVYD